MDRRKQGKVCVMLVYGKGRCWVHMHIHVHAFILTAALIRAADGTQAALHLQPSHVGMILFLEFHINNMETFLVKIDGDLVFHQPNLSMVSTGVSSKELGGVMLTFI